MRSRKARAVAATQAREWRLTAILLMTLTLIIVLALALSDAFAAGSGNSGSMPSPSSGNTDGSSSRNRDNNRDKDPATTSDEYEDAVDLIEDQKYQEAIAKLDKVNAKYPGNADVLNYLGYCNRKLGQFDKSMDFYKAALKVDSKHRGVHEYLGELFLQKKDLKKAETELSTLAFLCPKGCEEQKDLKEAIEAYKSTSASAASQ